MTDSFFLTKATLRESSSARNLLALSRRNGAPASGHQLLWTLFSDSAERQRDFLWRDTGGGGFLVLSRRPPEDRHNLFDLDMPRPFSPSLSEGQRLGFLLRANATVEARPGGRAAHGEAGWSRGKRSDVVMAAIKAIPPGPERATARAHAEKQAALAWLEAQGARHGFHVEGLSGLSYETVRIPHGKAPIRLGVLDLEGTLTVREPDLFLPALMHGFGRAKAYGCGLMLIRPASALAGD